MSKGMASSYSSVLKAPAKAERAAISVLIVDDEAHVRSYIAMLLRGIGISDIWQAKDGEEALALYRAHQPVAVLLDVNMPHVPGEKTFQRIREIDDQAAIVMVTSQNDMGVVRKFSEMGALGYVLKFAPKEIVANALAEALDNLIEPAEVVE